MHTSLQYALLFIVGAMVGAALGAVGMVLFLRSDSGKGVIQQYLATQPQWPSVDPGQSATTTRLIQDFIQGTAVIPVPKADATVAYAGALNASLRDISAIAASSTQLSNLLVTINNQSLARNYNGFFDLIVQAKAMVAVQRDQIVRFAQDLTALGAANQSTPDATTKALTQGLLDKGTALQSSLQTYNSALSQLPSGAVPSAAQLADLKAQAAVMESQAVDFSTAAKTLEQHFGIPQQ